MKLVMLFTATMMLAATSFVTSFGSPSVQASTYVERTNCPGSTAQAVIRSYYAAAVKGDNYGAEACLTFDLASRLERVEAPDWTNLRSLHITAMGQRSVKGKQRPPGTQSLPVVLEVAVHVVAQYKHPLGHKNGKGVVYIYLEKATSRSAWRIDTIADKPIK